MKILLINVTCNSGSTGKIVYDLYTEYKKQGHDVRICYGRGNKIDNPDIYKVTSRLGFYLHVLKTRLTGYVGSGNYFATWRLLKYIKSFNPDVVHLHNIHGYYVHAYKLLDYLKQSGVRVVYTLHDEWIFTGKCGYSYECEKWRTGCGKCPQIKEYPKSLFFDKTDKEFKRKVEIFNGFKNLIIAPVATWLKEKAIQSAHLANKQFVVTYNGIDTSVFCPKNTKSLIQKHNLENKWVLIHVTPNFEDKRKGGRYVLELAKRLEKHEDVVVIIIGMSNESIRHTHMTNNVIPINRTENQSQLAEYYSLGDMFLMVSEMECLPTVCLESLCCGTPIVGFDRGGAKETAPDSYGFFVPFGDVGVLNRKIEDLILGNFTLATSQQCKSYGKELYDKKVMVEKYVQLLKIKGGL